MPAKIHGQFSTRLYWKRFDFETAHKIIVITVFIIMQVSSCVCIDCTWDCRSIVSEQYAFTSTSSVIWWNYFLSITLDKYEVYESVLESVGHQFDSYRQICHIHYIFLLNPPRLTGKYGLQWCVLNHCKSHSVHCKPHCAHVENFV